MATMSRRRISPLFLTDSGRGRRAERGHRTGACRSVWRGRSSRDCGCSSHFDAAAGSGRAVPTAVVPWRWCTHHRTDAPPEPGKGAHRRYAGGKQGLACLHACARRFNLVVVSADAILTS